MASSSIACRDRGRQRCRHQKNGLRSREPGDASLRRIAAASNHLAALLRMSRTRKCGSTDSHLFGGNIHTELIGNCDNQRVIAQRRRLFLKAFDAKAPMPDNEQYYRQ